MPDASGSRGHRFPEASSLKTPCKHASEEEIFILPLISSWTCKVPARQVMLEMTEGLREETQVAYPTSGDKAVDAKVRNNIVPWGTVSTASLSGSPGLGLCGLPQGNGQSGCILPEVIQSTVRP